MKRQHSPTTSAADSDSSVDAKRICVLEAPTTLNEQQQRLFDYVTGRDEFEPVFVSGSAGTGKSALLKSLRKHWTAENKVVWVVSYTNLSARNVDGLTIHKQFNFDFNYNVRNDRCVGAPNYFILDEVSMVPAKMLQGIHTQLQASTRMDLPFGGVNTIIFGDLYQLPPISNIQSQQLPPFCADVWKSLSLYHLTINMRQSETDFIETLNLLRVGDTRCLEFFDQNVIEHNITIEDQVECTSLVPTHREADSINNKCYVYVKKNKHNEAPEYVMKVKVRREPRRKHTIIYATGQEELVFKDGLKYCEGTRVMITHNLKTAAFCNGDIGTVVSINEKGVVVRRECDGVEDSVPMVEMAFESGVFNNVKVVTGLPMCYAWAVTIHKSQGMTVKNLIVHPRNIFTEGQAYVAFSRVTHCRGLRLAHKMPATCVMKMPEVEAAYAAMIRLDTTKIDFTNEPIVEN
ncbi:helicase-2 [Betabaculovirus altermyunipunctae]|uniref:Helicase-2 n=1 Tax=Betabaculovirus altermyunipunctae TaxID=3051996 RepID=A0A1S5YEE6_9BBAC|nr:helicase-2 [Betabaculovirus altermyunipunctae]AQQ80397.1 helicase-2 [Betabaculovirus altermyunipunctae]